MPGIFLFGDPGDFRPLRERIRGLAEELEIAETYKEADLLDAARKGAADLLIVLKRPLVEGQARLDVLPKLRRARTAGKIVYLGRFYQEKRDSLKLGADLYLDADGIDTPARILRALARPRLALNSWHYFHVLKTGWAEAMRFDSLRVDFDALVRFSPRILLLEGERMTDDELEALVPLGDALPRMEAFLLTAFGQDDLEVKALGYAVTPLFDESEGQDTLRRRVEEKLHQIWLANVLA